MSSDILVTGATSELCIQLIKQLIAQGRSVRALVRSLDKGKSLARAGAKIIVGDLEKPRSLGAAFADVTSAFILTPPSPRAPEQFSNALWAAKQAGVKHVVRQSAFGAAHDAPTINGRLHALSDSELISSGVRYTIVKPHFFMQNLVMSAKAIVKEGVFRFPLGEEKLGLIDTRDISDFVEMILVQENSKSNIYTITGPKSISMNEVAAAIAGAVDKNVKYLPVSIEEALQELPIKPGDEFTLNSLRDYYTAYSEGWGDVVTDDFKDLMGKSPRSIASFAQENAGYFK